MKVEFVLNLNSITDASHFVSEISKMVACDVDVSYGRHCVDAKHLWGLCHYPVMMSKLLLIIRHVKKI